MSAPASRIAFTQSRHPARAAYRSDVSPPVGRYCTRGSFVIWFSQSRSGRPFQVVLEKIGNLEAPGLRALLEGTAGRNQASIGVTFHRSRYTTLDGNDLRNTVAHLPPGTGPRHLVALPDGSLVVVGELDARAHVLVRDGDGGVPASAVPLHPGAEAGTHFAAHVTLSADGSRLHVTVRGSDVLAVHRVRTPGGGTPPTLEHLADVPLGDGAWPRHHAVLGGPGACGRWSVRQGALDNDAHGIPQEAVFHDVFHGPELKTA
jgi:hypothetical protein